MILVGGAEPGVDLVFGLTYASAGKLRGLRPELAGAVLVSPLSYCAGMRVRRVFVEDGLDGLPPARAVGARQVMARLKRELARMGSELVVYVLPVEGPAVRVEIEAYLDRMGGDGGGG